MPNPLIYLSTFFFFCVLGLSITQERASIAKITRPKIKLILHRKRLFKLLDASRNHPITWISGPAGCGKTSLIASYLDSRKIPCIWYQVDEGDSDIASFFYYVGLAVKKPAPRRRKPLPLLTPEYLLGIPTFTLRFFENLCARLKTPYSLVFDNCHRVIPESPFHDVILTALSIIPVGLNIILISRNEPPSIYARLEANRQIGLIGWNELRFTPQESRTVIGFQAPEIRSKETMDRLHKITDGWVAGLVLISGGVKRGIEIRSLEKSVPEEIADYFGSELFSRTKKDLQTFLMKTALLPKMHGRSSASLERWMKNSEGDGQRMLFYLPKKPLGCTGGLFLPKRSNSPGLSRSESVSEVNF